MLRTLSKALWRESCRYLFQGQLGWRCLSQFRKFRFDFSWFSFHTFICYWDNCHFLLIWHLLALVQQWLCSSAFGSLDTEKDFFLISGIPSYPSTRPLSSYKSGCPVLIWMRNSKALSSFPIPDRKEQPWVIYWLRNRTCHVEPCLSRVKDSPKVRAPEIVFLNCRSTWQSCLLDKAFSVSQ